MLVVIVGLAVLVGIFAFYAWNKPEKVVIVEERWVWPDPWYWSGGSGRWRSYNRGYYGPSHGPGHGPGHGPSRHH